MKIKETKLLIEELRAIAKALPSRDYKGVLIESAQRLEDMEKIAEYFRRKAENACRRDK